MHDKGIHEKSVITGVGNIDIPGYQDCPPTDCPMPTKGAILRWGMLRFTIQKSDLRILSKLVVFDIKLGFLIEGIFY